MIDKKVQEILKKMSLEDKISLCSGKDFWHTKSFEKYGIPEIMMTDGPHGLRKQKDSADMLGINESEKATCFPTAVTLSATWNRQLIGEVGRAIGEEAKALDVPVVLGPGVNIKRNPLCGRNFEYMSEDPFVAGEMGAAYVSGMQETGIATSLKHFAANSQEYKRFSSDSCLDERTLREIYLAGFERVVRKAAPKTVMCAYNKINGTYCSDNKKLLTDILRDEWGFKGMVVTDWGAMNDRIESFKAGCDLSMPGGAPYMEAEAKRAVEDGRLSEADIDRSVSRVLKLVLEGQKVLDEKKADKIDIEAHHKIAKRAASEGIVLLKNEDRVLPVKDGEKVLIVGHMAEISRYQGAGSSHINPTKLDNFNEFFKSSEYIEGCNEKGNVLIGALSDISEKGKNADKIIVFAGLTDQYESEGFDRDTLDIPTGHLELIDAASKVNKNTIVVLMGGGVMALPFKNMVKGILYAGLSGQASGSAISDVVSGKTNPSGKLTESWPVSIGDVPSYGFYAGDKKNAYYREGIYVGYRYYDKAKKDVNYCFGHGLSYTSFEYNDLQIKTVDKESHNYEVITTVKNTGTVAGAEVVQIYIGNPQDGLHRPIKELKGFEKVFLNPGEEKKVSIMLDERSFSVYEGGFKVPAGVYQIMAGSSLCDIRLKQEIIVDGELVTVPLWQKDSWYENTTGKPTHEDFVKLMGTDVCEDNTLKKGFFTMNNTIKELSEYSFLAKKMCEIIENQIAKGMGIEPDYTNPEFRMAATSSVDCSMRGMIITSCGAFPERMAKAIVEGANGHKLKAVGKLIKG